MNNSDLFIYTIVSLIENRFKEVPLWCSSEIQFESDSVKKYIISLAEYGIPLRPIHISFRNYYNSGRINGDSIVLFEFQEFEQETNSQKYKRAKKDSIKTSVNSLISNYNSLIEEIFEKYQSINISTDLYTLLQSYIDSSDNLMVAISSDLALNAYMKGHSHVRHLNQQVNQVIDFIESRPKSDRNIVYLIFLSLINIHLTTNIEERRERIDKLRKTYVFTLNWRRRNFIPDLPKNPLPVLLLRKHRIRIQAVSVPFSEIYNNMIID